MTAIGRYVILERDIHQLNTDILEEEGSLLTLWRKLIRFVPKS